MEPREPIRLTALEQLADALNAAGVRYLVTGGMAVIAHGYIRMTVDIDLALQMEPENLQQALALFAKLGYRPALPVETAEFMNAESRSRWIREKGMLVFQLFNENSRFPPIDLFLEPPFDFAGELENAFYLELGSGVTIPVVSIATLVAMKETAKRDKDRADLLQLRRIQRGG